MFRLGMHSNIGSVEKNGMTTAPLEDFQTVGERDVDESASDHDHDKSVSSATSDSSDECPFSAEICTKLSAAFAKATGIDREFAVQLLKDHSWNVDQALKATYEAKEHAQSLLHSRYESTCSFLIIPRLTSRMF